MSLNVGLKPLLIHSLIFLTFAAGCFVINSQALFRGLDGAYILTLVDRNFHYGNFVPGLPPNYLQGLGSRFLFNPDFIPGFLLTFSWLPTTVAVPASYSLFAFSVFLTVYAIAREITCDFKTAILAGWAVCLASFPIFGTALWFPLFALVPHLSWQISLGVALLICFQRVGYGSFRTDLFFAVIFVLALSLLIAGQAMLVALIGPPAAAISVFLLIQDLRVRVFAAKAALVLIVFGLFWSVGLFDYYQGLMRASATSIFHDEFRGKLTHWPTISALFQSGPSGNIGRIVCIVALIAAGFEMRRRTEAGKYARALLCGVAMIVAGGLVVRHGLTYQGPSLVYFEVLFWPLYGVFFARGIVAGLGLGRRLIRPTGFDPVVIVPFIVGGAALAIFYSVFSAKSPERFFRYPPPPNPYVDILADRLGTNGKLAKSFSGRLATITATQIDRPVDWFDIHNHDSHVILKNFGLEPRFYVPWYFQVPTLAEYSQMTDPSYYALLTRTMARGDDQQVRNTVFIRELHPKLLRMLGVRFVLTDGEVSGQPLLMQKNQDLALSLFELEDPNLGGFSPTQVVLERDAQAIINTLRAQDFDPRASVVMSDPLTVDRKELLPVTTSTLALSSNGYEVSAHSAGTSILLLPVVFSRCLNLTLSEGGPVQLARANLIQTALRFSGTFRGELRLLSNPLAMNGCQLQDARELADFGLGATR